MLRPLAVALFAAATLVSRAPANAAPVALAAASKTIRVPVVTSVPPLTGTLTSPIWRQAARVRLTYDLRTHAPASEPTTVYLLTDGKALYVGFDAIQTRTPILATQRTDDVGQDTDDEVQIDLWPGGSNGFAYEFISTPNGTHYQSSSENLSYAPDWTSRGRVESGAYTVTMRIPLAIMRGAKTGRWLVQLSRSEPATGADYLYNGSVSTNNAHDVFSAEPLLGMPAIRIRPQARFAAYTLGAIAAPGIGGSTSRAGLDFAIPITASTSFFGTIHPDFSNVESDQQSISPSAFPRFYQETRPFFTQGANAYNYMECDECPGISTLYTPNIPTPRTGYALEGTQGRYTFSGFTANGVARNDNAQSVVFRTRPRTLFASLQRVGVSMPGFSDTSEFFASKWSDYKHKFLFANMAQENGTAVTDPRKAKMQMIGGGWYGANAFLGGNIVRMGSQYNPYDGFVSFNDVAGYGIFRNQNWNPGGGTIKNVNIYSFIDRYHGSDGALDNTDQAIGLNLTTRKLWEFSTITGNAYALVGNVFMPLTQNETSITYGAGTATPTQLGYATGRYGSGRLDSWYRSTSFQLNRRFTLTLEADSTSQFLDDGSRNTQWLERVSLAMQSGRDSSFALGLRRFIGTPPSPSGGGCVGICSNVSFAFHKRIGKREIYLAYGDPSRLITTPQFIVKLIDYVGADKGT